VPAEVWPAVLTAVRTAVRSHQAGLPAAVAISGRVPEGLPDDAVAQLVGLGTDVGVPVYVDSDGDQLAAAAHRRPTLVKVNAAEAAAATGADPEQPWVAAKALQALGAGTVVITLGPGGALCLAEDGRRLEVQHAPLPAALPVGSGDAFLAGLIAQRLRAPDDLPAALVHAAAAGRANARSLEAGSCTEAGLRAELSSITVRIVDQANAQP
jgi:fructose-1-phosphate kinase PfkB-like protein